MEHNGRCMLREQLPLLQGSARRLPAAGHAADVCLLGGDLWRQQRRFREQPQFERPLNVYGYSKLLFDDVVRRTLPSATSQVVGLRYFNVYGPREQHKGRMASVAFHHFNQYRDSRQGAAVRRVRRLWHRDNRRAISFMSTTWWR